MLWGCVLMLLCCLSGELVSLYGFGSTQGSWTHGCRCHSCLVGRNPFPSSQSLGGTLSACTLLPAVRRCRLCTSPVGPQCNRHRTCSQSELRRCPLYTAASGCVAPAVAAGRAMLVHSHFFSPNRSLCVGEQPISLAQRDHVWASKLEQRKARRWWAVLGATGRCRCWQYWTHNSHAWGSPTPGSTALSPHSPECCVHLVKKWICLD